jgi:hypothetical protein
MRCAGLPEENYGFYVLGTLSGAERAELDEHLFAGCETCSAEIARCHGLWFSVGQATPERKPPRSLRARIVSSVAPAAPSWWRRTLPVLLAASLMLAALAVGWVAGVGRSPLPAIAFAPRWLPPEIRETVVTGSPAPQPAVVVRQVPDAAQEQALEAAHLDLANERRKTEQLDADLARERDLAAGARNELNETQQRYRAAVERGAAAEELARRVATLTARAAELERQVAQYRVLLQTERNRLDQSTQLAALASDPSLRVVRLRGTEKGQSIEGHALIAGGTQMVFYASQLPALPANRVWQLWLVRSSGTAIASAGTFVADAGKRGFVAFRDSALLGGVTAMAVTDEPAGGSPQPTGHKWLIGS